MGYINIDWKYRNDYYNTNSNNCIIPLNNKIEIKQYIYLNFNNSENNIFN